MRHSSHPFHGPGQVCCCRTCRDNFTAYGIKPFLKSFCVNGTDFHGTQGNAHCPGYTDGWSASNNKSLNCTNDPAIILADHILLLHRQLALIDHDNLVVFPNNRFQHKPIPLQVNNFELCG